MLGWFFTGVFIYAGQPPVSEKIGPFRDEQSCMTRAITMKADMPIMQATPCTKEHVKKGAKFYGDPN